MRIRRITQARRADDGSGRLLGKHFLGAVPENSEKNQPKDSGIAEIDSNSAFNPLKVDEMIRDSLHHSAPPFIPRKPEKLLSPPDVWRSV